MTPEILEYLLRLTVIWAVLLAYYFVALRQAGFAVQRFYLLGSLAFGLVVPLLPALGGGLPVVGLPSVTYVAEPFFYTGEAEVSIATSSWSWFTVLLWLYFTGTAFFLARTLVQWKGLWQWVSSGKKDRYDGYRVIRHENIGGPFVAFGYIFLPDAMTDADLENTALIHEASHLRARHHYDTLLLTIGSLLLWFHPFFWMLRRLLATVHEYEADAAVIQRVPVRTYGLQLLQASLGPAGFSGLFSSPITKRITMITDKTQGRKLRLFPLLTLCLLLAGLLVACSDVGEDVAVPLDNYNPFSEMDVDPFEHMEEPTVNGEAPFVGDVFLLEGLDHSMAKSPEEMELVKAIYERIRYPEIARVAGQTGTFKEAFMIMNDGIVKRVYHDNPLIQQPILELVIVGQGKPSATSKVDEKLFLEEINRALDGIDLGKAFAVDDQGRARDAAAVINFTFRLEE